MAAPGKPAIPATMLRRREKWLKAIEAGDIKAAVKAGGGKPEGPIGQEFLGTDIDNEIGHLLADTREHIQALGTEATEGLSAYEAEKGGLGLRQRQSRVKAIQSKLIKQKALIAWVEDVRMLRSPELPYFGASPVEVLLREGNQEGLKQVLREWASPRRRYLRGFHYNHHDIGWTSPEALPFEARLKEGFKRIPLVTLAAIRGDTVAMQMLVQAGLCPTGWGWADESEALLNLAERMKDGYPDARKVLKQYGLARGRLSAAAARLDRMGSLDQELEDVFESETYNSGGRKKAFALLKKGAPVGYYALARATEEDDIEMLEALFAAGGDPNCVYKSGVPMLAKLNKASARAVQVWLERGACPLMFHDAGAPDFGDDWCPSPLYQAVWEADLDRVRLLLEKAVVAPVIAFREGRKYVNPMADLARERGHAKLAAYLKDYVARTKA
jgi:hypothetical protein